MNEFKYMFQIGDTGNIRVVEGIAVANREHGSSVWLQFRRPPHPDGKKADRDLNLRLTRAGAIELLQKLAFEFGLRVSNGG